MSLRDKLNKSGSAVTIGVIAVVAVCGWMIYQYAGAGPAGPPVGARFFTVDEGKSLFSDTRSAYPAFQRDGKDAYMAKVYTCDGGKTQFVAYLTRVESPKSATSDRLMISIRRPGDAKWVPDQSGEGMKIMRAIKCPSGAEGKLEEVKP